MTSLKEKSTKGSIFNKKNKSLCAKNGAFSAVQLIYCPVGVNTKANCINVYLFDKLFQGLFVL